MLLKKFWFCYELEHGGILMGYAGTFLNALYIILLTFFLALGGATVSAAFEFYKKTSGESNEISSTLTNFRDENKSIADVLGIGIALFSFIIVLIYAALFLRLWAYISLLYGTKKRDHRHIFRFIIVDGIFVILNFGFLFFSVRAILYILQVVYLSLCTYSLYMKIKNENENTTNLSVTYDLTAVGTNYPMMQNVPQLQQAHGYAQQQYPQAYPQVSAYQQPQADQQPPTYHETLKFVEANELPPKV